MSESKKSWGELADQLSECIKILDLTDKRISHLHLHMHEMLMRFKRKQKEFDEAQGKDPYKNWPKTDED
jgi:hypothetical protein